MKKIILIATFLAAGFAQLRAQDADPTMTEMVPPVSGVIAFGATNTLLVKVANLGGSTPIVQNSLRVTVTTGLNTEILGVGPGSDPHWTVAFLGLGPGNTIRLTNSAIGPIAAGDFVNIVLNVKGQVLGGPLTVAGQVSYIAGPNPLLGGQPSASQGDDGTNNSATTSLTVTIPAPLHFGLSSVKDNNCSGTISWKTLDEQNVASFDVQQSFDGVNFASVKTIASKGNGANNYEVSVDQQSKKMYYRVVATDIDGRKAFGQIMALQLSNCKRASVMQVYPIPAYRDQQVTMITNSDEKVTFRLVDMSGKVIQSGTFLRNKKINILVGGTYLLEMMGESFKETQTVVVQ